jgi:hypothetical protein
MKQFILRILAITLFLGQSSVWAGGTPATCSTGYTCSAPSVTASSSAYRIDNRAYAGLSWDLDGSNGFIPDLILGARSLNVNSSDTVNGADFNIRLSYKGALGVDSIRLSYVGGSRQFMGNAGLGYSFANSSILGTAAAQAAYFRLGVDYLFSKQAIKPYLEGNSLYAPKPVNSNPGSTTCSSGSSLVSASAVSASASQSANGQTCISNLAPNG